MRSGAGSSVRTGRSSNRFLGTPHATTIVSRQSSRASSTAGRSGCAQRARRIEKERAVRQLSRRTVLRGLGAAVALPFLDAMYPAFAAQAVKRALAANRMAFLYVPNGIVMEEWTPAGNAGSTPLQELPRISRALAPYKNDVLMLTGLASDAGREHGDGSGDHARAGDRKSTR